MLYRNDPRLEVRSAGVRAEAQRRIGASDITWADVIFVMEPGHKKWIVERFRDTTLPPIITLDIPDDFVAHDPELQSLLRASVGPELERLLGE